MSGNSLSSSTATTFGRRSVVEDVVDSTLTIFADNNDVSIPGNGTSSASNVDDVVLNTDDTNVVVVDAAVVVVAVVVSDLETGLTKLL